MNICSSYHVSTKLWNSLDEIRFSIGASLAAIDYANAHPDKKVIIEVLAADSQNLSIDTIHGLIEENANIYFDFYDIDDLINYSDKNKRYMYHFPVNTYNMLYFLLQYKVSDITIGEPLCFELDTLKLVLDKLDEEDRPHIRVNPTIGRPSLFNSISDVDDGTKHFWFLPQHIEVYDKYIDVIDLIDENPVREETLIRLFQNKQYNDELKYYVKNCENDTAAELLDDKFAHRRLNCHQSCMRGKSSFYCNYCDIETKLFKQLVKTMHKL